MRKPITILTLSDLHIDHAEQVPGTDPMDDLILFIKEKKPDRIVIAGDIKGTAKKTIETIEYLTKQTQIPVSFVPGNHDIWVTGEHQSSRDSYQILSEHPLCLIDKPVHLSDNWVLLGEMGWHDYTFGPTYINKEEYPSIKRDFWTNDYRHARWQATDEQVCEWMLQKIEKTLEAHQDKNVIFVTHFIPWIDFVTFKRDQRWNACNAFLGSKKIGKLLDRYPNVKTVVFGHTHTKREDTEFGEKTVICKPIGYQKEWTTEGYKTEIEKWTHLIEIYE